MISPGRIWCLLRRDFGRGWEASWHAYRTLPAIEKWDWQFAGEPPQKIPVHLLTGRNDWRLAAWMLASWFQFSEHAWQVFVHDDGTLPPAGRETLRRLFPTARFISRAEADAALETKIKAFPFCDDYRRRHPLALKLFDIPHFTPGERFLVFDSDVLFLNHPREILDWVDAENEECWFNEDVSEGSLVSAAEARDELGVKIWPRVNSGLALLYKPAIDLELIDRALAQTSILRGHVWRIEQTLMMLCAARHGKGGLLPKRYEVSLGKSVSHDAVTRHYVGAVRDRFYAEGVKRLRPLLLPQEV